MNNNEAMNNIEKNSMENKQNFEKEKRQYVALNIGEEQYGIDINYVESIVKMQKITRVPKSLIYIKGMINLRGEIIPVMSLRKRFEVDEAPYDKKTRIVIVKMQPQAPIGIIVDGVREVVSLTDDDIDRIAVDENDQYSKYIVGVGRVKNSDVLITILNIINVIGIDISDED